MPLSRISELIETTIREVTPEAELTARHTWELPCADTTIQVAYHERTGQICIETLLGDQAQYSSDTYTFLLKRNAGLPSMTLSLRDTQIWLHSIIDERNISAAGFSKLLQITTEEVREIRETLQQVHEVNFT